MTNFGWTEESVGLLRDLWAEGLSSSAIGVELGVTRNSVLGKAYRLGLKPRPLSVESDKQSGQKALPETIKVSAAKARVAPKVPHVKNKSRFTSVSRSPNLLAATLYVVDPKGSGCMWPIGDPKDPDFHFCGSLSAVGRSYCPEHCTVAYLRKERHAA